MRLLYTIRYCILIAVFTLFYSSVHAQHIPKQHGEHVKPYNIQQRLDSLNYVFLEADDTTRVYLLCLMAITIRDENIEAAMLYVKRAIKLADSLRHISSRAKAYRIQGNLYWVKADYKNALFYYLNALKLHETIEDKNGIAEVYHNIGTVYENMSQQELAKKYYLACIRLKKEIGDTNTAVYTYNNLGTLLYRIGDFKESIRYFKKVEQETRRLQDNKARNQALLNLGEAYLQLQQPDEAAYYFNTVLNSNKVTNYDIIGSKNGLGRVAMAQNRLDLAQEHLLSALAIAKNMGLRKLMLTTLERLTILYERRYEPDKALKYYKQYHALNDSINNVAVASQIKQIQESYEVEKRDKQIQLLNKDNEIKAANAAKEKLLAYAFIAGLAGVLVIILFIARNIILKQKMQRKILSEKNAQVQLQKQQIENYNVRLLRENTESRYEVLKSKINPHFLFNNLNTLAAIVLRDQRAAFEYIGHFSELYRVILKTGKSAMVSLGTEMNIVKHYLYLQQIGFREKLIIDISHKVEENLNSMILPFSIQMAVENAIKHNIITMDKKLKIQINIEDNQVVITNNLQRKSQGLSSTSTGQQNITERYTFLSNDKPSFIETDCHYIVKLPLLNKSLSVNKIKNNSFVSDKESPIVI